MQLNDPEFSTARQTALEIQRQIEQKSHQKAEKLGRNRGFTEETNRLKRDLASDMFKDAERAYHNHRIKCSVGTQTQKDLDNYIVAYKRAVMRCHRDKMEKINRCLRDLWVSWDLSREQL